MTDTPLTRRENLRAKAGRIFANWEAAQPRSDLWNLASYRDADATLQAEVRREVRARSRYEIANNGHIARVVNVWADDLVGSPGPSLEFNTGNKQVDNFLNRQWRKHWKKINGQLKFKTAVIAYEQDGEVVALKYLSHQNRVVQTDARIVESDRLSTPGLGARHEKNYVDGVHLDQVSKEPVAYDILDQHPGNEFVDGVDVYDHDTYPWADCLHVYRPYRPEAHRGVSRCLPALPLSGICRKFLTAKLTKAERQAAIATAFKSNLPVGEEDEATDENAYDVIDLPNGSGWALVLPDLMEPIEFRTDGDSDDIEELKNVIVQLYAGCYSMPLGRALGKYDGGDYAQIRAELKPYQSRLDAERKEIWEPLFLERLVDWWWAEFRLTHRWRSFVEKHEVDEFELEIDERTWQWAPSELIVDPSRESEAINKRLANGSLCRSDVVDGDIDIHDKKAARELGFNNEQEYREALRIPLGMSVQQVQAGQQDGKSNEQSKSDKPAKVQAALESPAKLSDVDRDILRRLLDVADDDPFSKPEKQEIQRWLDDVSAALELNANCGTGAGGFQPGNKCQRGGGSATPSGGGGRSIMDAVRYAQRVTKNAAVAHFKVMAFAVTAATGATIAAEVGGKLLKKLGAAEALAAAALLNGSLEPDDELHACGCGEPANPEALIRWARDELRTADFEQKIRRKVLKQMAELFDIEAEDSLLACDCRQMDREQLLTAIARNAGEKSPEEREKLLRAAVVVIDLDAELAKEVATMEGWLLANCGTGAGGFKPGNKCARGGGGSGLASRVQRKVRNTSKSISKDAQQTARTAGEEARKVVDAVREAGESYTRSIKSAAAALMSSGREWLPVASRVALTSAMIAPGLSSEYRIAVAAVMLRSIGKEFTQSGPKQLLDWLL